MLARQFKVAFINNTLDEPYWSYGDHWKDGFEEAGCQVEVFRYEDIRNISPRYDLYFFMDIRYDPAIIPWYLGPRVVYSFDAHNTGVSYWEGMAKHFDYVALASKNVIETLQSTLENPRKFIWLPEACNPKVHRPLGLPTQKHKVGFIGNPCDIKRGEYSRYDIQKFLCGRDDYFDLKMVYGLDFNAYGDKYNQFLNMFPVCLDWPVANNLGTRIFEASAVGSAVLYPNVQDDNGLKELFPSTHYMPYEPTPEGVTAALELLLKDDGALATSIGKSAREHVLNNHTYAHRVSHLLKMMGYMDILWMGKAF